MISLCINKVERTKYDKFSADLIVSVNDLEYNMNNIELDELTADSKDRNIFGRLALKFEEMINLDAKIQSILKEHGAEKILVKTYISTINAEVGDDEDNLMCKNINIEFGLLRNGEVIDLESCLSFTSKLCTYLEEIEFWAYRFGEFDRFIDFKMKYNTKTNLYKLNDTKLYGLFDEYLEDFILDILRNFEVD